MREKREVEIREGEGGREGEMEEYTGIENMDIMRNIKRQGP